MPPNLIEEISPKLWQTKYHMLIKTKLKKYSETLSRKQNTNINNNTYDVLFHLIYDLFTQLCRYLPRVIQ